MYILSVTVISPFFFFNDTATPEIYTTRHTLSLHDALPISPIARPSRISRGRCSCARSPRSEEHTSELQSRLVISYAVFCLKKKNKKKYLIIVVLILFKNKLRKDKIQV